MFHSPAARFATQILPLDPLVIDDDRFRIRVDPARKYVDAELFGHWDSPAMDRFERAIDRVIAHLAAHGIRAGEQVSLFDTSRYAVQSQDVVTRMGAMTANPAIGSRKIAVVPASALLKMQAQRIAPGYVLFNDRTAAIDWLFGPDD